MSTLVPLYFPETDCNHLRKSLYSVGTLGSESRACRASFVVAVVLMPVWVEVFETPPGLRVAYAAVAAAPAPNIAPALRKSRLFIQPPDWDARNHAGPDSAASPAATLSNCISFLFSSSKSTKMSPVFLTLEA